MAVLLAGFSAKIIINKTGDKKAAVERICPGGSKDNVAGSNVCLDNCSNVDNLIQDTLKYNQHGIAVIDIGWLPER